MVVIYKSSSKCDHHSVYFSLVMNITRKRCNEGEFHNVHHRNMYPDCINHHHQGLSISSPPLSVWIQEVIYVRKEPNMQNISVWLNPILIKCIKYMSEQRSGSRLLKMSFNGYANISYYVFYSLLHDNADNKEKLKQQ